jgi:hypothetical protein
MRHYAKYGRGEGRAYGAPQNTGSDNWGAGETYDQSVIPDDFSWLAYLDPANNPDLRAAGLDTPEEAMRHYSRYGMNEGRQYMPTRYRGVNER